MSAQQAIAQTELQQRAKAKSSSSCSSAHQHLSLLKPALHSFSVEVYLSSDLYEIILCHKGSPHSGWLYITALKRDLPANTTLRISFLNVYIIV